MTNKITLLCLIGLWSLACFTFISVSLTSLSHLCFFIAACLAFKSFKIYRPSISFYFLCALCLAMGLSVVFNLDLIDRPLKKLFKIKYYLIAILAIFPLKLLFEREVNKNIFKAFLFCTTLASLAGLIGLWTGFNPIKMKAACHETRACGAFGMYMTYGYGIGLFLLPLSYLVIKKISLKWTVPLFIINFLGLIFNYARGAYLGYFLALPFYFLKNYKKRFLSLCLIIFCFGALSYVLSPKIQNFVGSPNRLKSIEHRIDLYKAGLYAFKERPLLGYGFKNFEPHSKNIKLKYDIGNKNFGGHAHSNYIEALASTGLLGFLCFLGFIISWLIETYKRDDFWSQMHFPLIIGFMISGLFQYTFGDGENLFYLMGVYSVGEALKTKY